MEQKTTQAPARLLRVQAAPAASRGIKPHAAHLRWCLRPMTPGLAAEQRHARVHTHTHVCTHPPMARRATAGRRGDAGASSPRHGAAGAGGTGDVAAGTLAAAGTPVQPRHAGSARRAAHPPARSSSPSSPPAQRLLPPVSMGTRQENTVSSKASASPGSPNPGGERPHHRVWPEDHCARSCPGGVGTPRHSPSPPGDSQGRGQGDGGARRQDGTGGLVAAGWVPRPTGLPSMGWGCWGCSPPSPGRLQPRWPQTSQRGQAVRSPCDF